MQRMEFDVTRFEAFCAERGADWRASRTLADLLQKIPAHGVRWMQPDVRYCYGPDVIQFHPVEYRVKRE